ncbi:hypothetical protein BH24DEI1_BH24DEI1_08230 [soil metagenome]
MDKKRTPQAQQHQTLDRLEVRLMDGTTLAYASGQTQVIGSSPAPTIAEAIRRALNSAYCLRGYDPPFPSTSKEAPCRLASLIVTLTDDRAYNQPHMRTVVRFLIAEDGQRVTGFDCTSEPGAIYLYVYDHDLAEVAREVQGKVLPLIGGEQDEAP